SSPLLTPPSVPDPLSLHDALPISVRALLEHADDGAQLALGPLEAVDHGSHVSRIEFHEVLLGSATAPRCYTPRGVLRTPRGICNARRAHRESPPHIGSQHRADGRGPVAPTSASRDLRIRATR